MLGNECAFVLDTKQAIRAGENPYRFIELLGGKIVHAHVSDSGELGDCLPVGKGRFDFNRFYERLWKANPGCTSVLELYRSGFGGISELISSYNILSNITGKFGKEQTG